MEEITMDENKEEVKEEVKNPEAVLAELRRAQDDLKTLRAENKELKGKVETLESDTDADKWKNRALTAETKLALEGMGLKDVDRLMKYVGTEGLEFDEDGAVKGLEERLETLKADLPEIFDPKKRVGGNADIFANQPPDTYKSLTESQVDALFKS